MKILIVEDEVISALALRLQLIKAGYDVCPIAASGIKAIEICGQEKPDLALMDIRLKGSKNGIETAGILSARFNIPSIFMSGYEQKDILNSLGDRAGVIIMKKPIDFQALVKNLESLPE